MGEEQRKLHKLKACSSVHDGGGAAILLQSLNGHSSSSSDAIDCEVTAEKFDIHIYARMYPGASCGHIFASAILKLP
jgi:hypothetical protein